MSYIYDIVSEEVFDGLVKEMYDVLRDRNYSPSKGPVKDIVKETIECKKSLIELLRKHPNWDESHLRVHFDADIQRMSQSKVARVKLNNLADLFNNRWRYFRIKKNALNDFCWGDMNLPEDEAGQEEYLNDYENAKKKAEIFLRLDVFVGEALYWKDWTENPAVTEDMKERVLNQMNLNGFSVDLHCNVGAKTTRALWKLLRELGVETELDEDTLHEVRRLYAEYADAMNPITIKRHTVLSVNPTDFLLMSNGNSWTSCHYIGNAPEYAGCYSAGALSYAMDEQTMIFYTVDAGVSDEYLTQEPKITRQLYFWNGEAITGSRIYPQGTDGNDTAYASQRSIVEKVMAECLSAPNLWKKLPFSADYVSEGLHYRDYECHAYPSFVLSGTDFGDKQVYWIGGECRCPQCGEYNEEYEDNILCEKCARGGNIVYCHDCGREIDLDDDYDDYYYDEDRDQYFCYNCVSVCDHCGDTYPTMYGESNSNGEWFCEGCVDDGSVYECDECGEYFDVDDLIYDENLDQYFCEECFNRTHDVCDVCGEDIYKSDLQERMDPETGEVILLCSDCVDEWDSEHGIAQCDHCGAHIPEDELVEVTNPRSGFVLRVCPVCAIKLKKEWGVVEDVAKVA